jgi:hypothetical protein
MYLQVIINIEKKHLTFLVLFVMIIGFTGFAIAYGGNNPPVLGHTFGEMAGGTAQLGTINGGSIPGIIIEGTPVDGETILTITNNDIDMGDADGNALRVYGHIVVSDGKLQLPLLTQGLTQGEHSLCLYKSGTGDGHDNGKIMVCS